MKVTTWIADTIRDRDHYPSTVQLTYKGQTKFKTMFGGIVTIFIKVWVIAYAGKLLSDVLNRGNTNQSVYTTVKDLVYDDTKHYPGKGTFAIAFKLFGPHPERFTDSSYMNFTFSQVGYQKSSTSGQLLPTATKIELEECGDNYPFVNDELYKRKGLASYLCPKHSDWYISSNFNSESYTTLQIDLNIWTGAGCQSTADIESTLNTHQLDLAIINSYFDFNDYENPVKTYLEDINFFSLIPKELEITWFKIRHNEYISDKNYFYQGFPETGSFYSVEPKQNRKANYAMSGGSTVWRCYIFFSQESSQYERYVFTLFDLFGVIGGIYEIFLIAGAFIVLGMNEKIFYSSILSNLYQIEDDSQSESKKVNSRVAPSIHTNLNLSEIRIS